MPNLRLPVRLLLLAILLICTAAPAATVSASPAAGCTQPYCSYVPAVYTGSASAPTQDRQAARAFYLTEYLNSDNVAPNWTGDRGACDPGATSADFRAAVLQRINYFRVMAGVPSLRGLSDAYNARAQAAALMMSANRQLSHTPPPTWTCYSAGGAEAAGKSNLSLGVFGPAAITGYIMDAGDANYTAGHRRWVLFPPTQHMGSGDVPAGAGYPASNALWVFDTFDPAPGTREPYVAWPPPGYVPYVVVFALVLLIPRGRFYAGDRDHALRRRGDHRNASARRQRLRRQHACLGSTGAANEAWPRPVQDTTYTVTLTNVLIDGQPRSFTYGVVVFDPGA